MAQQIPGATLGVQRFEREQRVDVPRVLVQHGLETADRSHRIGELVAPDLAFAQQGGDRELRVLGRLRFARKLVVFLD